MEQLSQSIQLCCHRCCPKSTIRFILRYLSEEKLSFANIPNVPTGAVLTQIIEQYHAIHQLPFLITQPEEFRNTACIIFCAEQMHGHFSKDNHQFVIRSGGNTVFATAQTNNSEDISKLASISTDSAQPMIAKEITLSDNASNQYREFLDGSTLIDIIQAMDISSFGLQNTVIEEIIVEKLESLKKIDFTLFLSAVRFPIILYQAYSWLKDELFFFMKSLEYTTSPSNFFPVREDLLVDISKIKSFFLKKSTLPSSSNTKSTAKVEQSVRFKLAKLKETHNYHLFPIDVEDTRHWTKVLLAVIEEEKGVQTITALELSNGFLRKLVCS